MKSTRTSDVVKKIIKLYGPVIDLEANPGVMIDILRKFNDPLDGGSPIGGTPLPAPEPPPPEPPPAPEPPPTPPGPSRAGDWVTNDDVLRAVLKLSREVNAIKKALPITKSRTRR